MLKKILFTLYIIIIVCMATATIVEKYHGTEFAHEHFYGAWWFTLVWALLTAFGVFYIVKQHVRRPSTVVLHASFVVILLGALITHLFSERGMIHLRTGEVTDTYFVDNGRAGVAEHQLPFKLRLNDFKVQYHDGTSAEQDYESNVTVIDGGHEKNFNVAMNKIMSYRSVRFYQSNYDQDMRGSVLSINSDPWGIAVAYTGYGLLFLSLLWMLIDPKGAYRRVLRSEALRRGVLTVAALLCFGMGASAAPVLPKETAEKFGELNILYNNRICPLQTFAIDFTKKLTGSATYDGCTAEQVLTGFIFWGDEWSKEPLIKMKGGELRETLQLPKHVSVNTFFNNDMGGYIIGPYVQEYFQGNQDAFHKQVADIDDRLQLVMNLRHGLLLKVFPFTAKGHTTWYAPNDKPGPDVDAAHVQFMQNVFSLLNQEVQNGNYGGVNSILDKMIKYQTKNAGTSLPSPLQLKAERMYNAFPFATVLFMVNLAMGFLLFILSPSLTLQSPSLTLPRGEGTEVTNESPTLTLPRGEGTEVTNESPSLTLPRGEGTEVTNESPSLTLPRGEGTEATNKACTTNKGNLNTLPTGEGRGGAAACRVGALGAAIMLLSFLALTLCLTLRWIISGTVPMANGYETMLFMSWLIMLCSLLLCRKFRIILTFGFIMSGFFLLVSHINQMDPQITPVMPVLNSPLLSVHVSIIMTAFAMLSLTFICGIMAVALRLIKGKNAAGLDAQLDTLRVLSDLFLYPALTALGFGIFIGSIWANVSWGTYWSWDSKEVWGLITFMIYAVSMHRASVPFLRRPIGYHVFMVLAFLSILMTYFGVNYFLSGMHSYA